ncbi:MAG: type II toxin-antitoxin system HicA family toxin [Fimbriimonadales bacterium]
MQVRDVLEKLREEGWVIERTRGSHRQFVHPTKQGTVTVSGHASDDVHPKTLKSIWRQAGIEQ